MNIPHNLLYTKEHEWIRIEGEVAVAGITDYAQGELGDIVYVELPQIGEHFEKGESFGTIEAVKAVSDLFAPLSGEVVEVNKSLEDAPEQINNSPYGDGWMVKIRISDISEKVDLLDAADYQALIGEA
ncbi:MAG: glycine cleavage system protein GcvH [bacterium]